ncbi:MAG: hypothetical protein JJ863_05290 [Deltaproteobacteria bacterium]|nr:hypothetical protein [Deltaproteobacteria bacterium]
MTPEVDDSKRDIWVLGFRDSDERPEKALGRVFGIDSVRARRLIASMPAVVKREVTAAQAEPIIAALRKIGARVALVPAGASRFPGKPASDPPKPAATATPEPEPEADGLGDIESLGIDFGPGGPPVSGSHPSYRESLPHPRVSGVPTEPARVSVAPPEPEPTPAPPKPVTFLEPRSIPEEPEPAPERSVVGAQLFGVVASGAGAAALFFASTLEGSAFGETPDVVGAASAAGAIALLLLGVQALVAAFAFDVALPKGGAIGLALLLGAAVGATSFLVHRVDPSEQARRERAATLEAIRQGRMPEARTFLTGPRAGLTGMERRAAVAWVEALYTAGARQVYVVVDYEAAPDEGTGVAISLPLTQSRRRAVAAAVHQQVRNAPADDGEWWLIPFE